MSYSSTLDTLVKGLDDYPDEFTTAIGKVQVRVLDEILPLFDALELDEFGNVLANTNNYAISNDITRNLKRIVAESGYREALNKLGADMAKQRAVTDSLYRIILEESVSFAEFNTVFTNTRQTALRLLGEGAISNFSTQLTGAVETAISSSSRYTQIITSIRNTVTGNADVDGVLFKYAKQNAKDAFAIQNRVYSEQINKKYGIQWYRYSGANMDTTRPFCLERQGKFFHEKEVQSWAGKTWQGKNGNTNTATIFSYLGGYNCNHYLAATPVDKVPAEYISAAISKGYVNKEDLPEKVQAKL